MQELKRNKPEHLKTLRYLGTLVFSMLVSAVASSLADIILYSKKIPSFLLLPIIGFAAVLAISILIVSRISEERRRGYRIKADVQAAYLAALAESSLDPERGRLRHAK